MENKTQSNFTLSSIFVRFLIGFAAGFVGAIVVGILLFLTWNIVGGTLAPSDVMKNEFGLNVEADTHPLFLSIITLAFFLGTLVANLTYVLLSTIVEASYTQRSTVMTQVFFGNLVFLLLMLPVYMLGNKNFSSSGIAVSGALHLVLSTFFSFFALEALHQHKHLLVNVYGMLFGIILFFLVGNVFSSSQTPMMTFLLGLPILLGLMAFGNRTGEVFYNWLYQNYGSDFLNIDTKFGADYGEDRESSHDFEV